MNAVPSDVESLASVLARGREAQAVAERWPQEKADQAVAAAGWSVFQESHARRLTSLAFHETGLGDAEETYIRHRRRVLGTLRDLYAAVTVGVIEEDRSRGLRKIAKPMGLIAAMTPTTAPTAAVAQNALMALKTRNAIVFCPHPKAARTAAAVTEVLRHALARIEAPGDLVQCIPAPDRDKAQQLMADVDLILAAGGEGTVRRAYSSGTPAYGAGTGNAVVIIDETANIDDACAQIFRGKHFDNGTSCSSESSLLIAQSVWDRVLAALQRKATYLCDGAETARLRKLMWPDGETLSRLVVGKSAETIAKLGGIQVPVGTRVLLAVPDCAPGVDPFSREKLCPVLALWRYQEFNEAISQVGELTQASGRGHSCGIFSQQQARIEQLVNAVSLTRVMVNQSTGSGNSGDFANGMPFTTTLCCGTWGGSNLSENVTWRHLLNYTWVSEPIEERAADPELLFGAHWAKYGRV
jgi:sulfoacetaldehyde dehydrogenase